MKISQQPVNFIALRPSYTIDWHRPSNLVKSPRLSGPDKLFSLFRGLLHRDRRIIQFSPPKIVRINPIYPTLHLCWTRWFFLIIFQIMWEQLFEEVRILPNHISL